MEKFGRKTYCRVSRNVKINNNFNCHLCTFRKDAVQKEFDDYTTDSQQLEKEYEATIDQNERTIRELKTISNRNHNELESLKVSTYDSLTNLLILFWLSSLN